MPLFCRQSYSFSFILPNNSDVFIKDSTEKLPLYCCTGGVGKFSEFMYSGNGKQSLEVEKNMVDDKNAK